MSLDELVTTQAKSTEAIALLDKRNVELAATVQTALASIEKVTKDNEALQAAIKANSESLKIVMDDNDKLKVELEGSKNELTLTKAAIETGKLNAAPAIVRAPVLGESLQSLGVMMIERIKQAPTLESNALTPAMHERRVKLLEGKGDVRTREDNHFPLFESGDQFDFFMSNRNLIKYAFKTKNPNLLNEANAPFGSGADVGAARSFYPEIVKFQRNIVNLADFADVASVSNPIEQYTQYLGNSGVQAGYQAAPLGSGGANTTLATKQYTVTLQRLWANIVIGLDFIDDIPMFVSKFLSDLMDEFAQTIAFQEINNNASAAPAAFGTNLLTNLAGSSFYQGLDLYNGTATNGNASQPAFDQSPNSNNCSLGTYRVATDGAITLDDLINFVSAVPLQYRRRGMWALYMNEDTLRRIRNLKTTDGNSVFDRISPLLYDAYPDRFMEFPVMVMPTLDSAAATAGTNKFPIYFANFEEGYRIIRKNNLYIDQFVQTNPGFMTFFATIRQGASVKDPNYIWRMQTSG